jgi:hypothetical protein
VAVVSESSEYIVYCFIGTPLPQDVIMTSTNSITLQPQFPEMAEETKLLVLVCRGEVEIIEGLE